MLMFHLCYIGCVFVYLMYIYRSFEINIYLSSYYNIPDHTGDLAQNCPDHYHYLSTFLLAVG